CARRIRGGWPYFDFW
nr:immunoglobulin heavy chain junction region [Macaca mulatta]MOX61687.1 immunoglobulin heavy chain junction region [Macaca mulatta]MOX61883.1 immunoglobulin heavy chain junction region [Macaca mulatta]MOX62491.1 immunoglobulin heavy chain junction region [Macaca mulatta]MOX63057.1 immunoglobulin heavy chain junction region [Macaca mulatta]